MELGHWLTIYILGLAMIVRAILEIQTEGKDGMAKNLPCWKKETGWAVKHVMGGRPVTGYHLALWADTLIFLHIILFFNLNLRAELYILGVFLAFLIIQDFFWFVLNPHYGIKKFKKEYIDWHLHWYGPLPREYYYVLPVAGLLIYFGLPGIS